MRKWCFALHQVKGQNKFHKTIKGGRRVKTVFLFAPQTPKEARIIASQIVFFVPPKR